jgi:hypothetical protein
MKGTHTAQCPMVIAPYAGCIDYAQAVTQGEELMFIMDVPYVPVQDTPIVLVQAATSGDGSTTQQSDYVLKDCMETINGGDPRSAMRAVDPAGMLAVYFEQYKGAKFIDLANIKTILLDGTAHGKITSVVDNTGRTWYRYDAELGYEGEDNAVFIAEYQGMRYKIVVEIKVSTEVDENSPQCPPPKLIKVNRKPVSGALGSDINVSILDSLSVDPSLVTLNIADLPGGAVGQTTETGNTATITLDDNAAGNGWFIDNTNADNSEFLPTSNPNEWVAKAGSDAAVKMDMLSVLLHEYGHVPGI